VCEELCVGVCEASEVNLQLPFREVRRIQYEHACSPDEPARYKGIAFEPVQGTRNRRNRSGEKPGEFPWKTRSEQRERHQCASSGLSPKRTGNGLDHHMGTYDH